MKALLSVKPEYAEKIFTREKRFEFRKVCFKESIQTVIVYATMPVGKIIGEFDIEFVLKDSPNRLWEKTKEYAGIPMEYFHEYFSGRDVGYAIKIKEVRRYQKGKDPYEDDIDFTPPQSFRYIKERVA